MKKKLIFKEKFTAEIKKVLGRVKPMQEKIEKILSTNPTFQKWVERSSPWRRKIRASVIVNLNKARTVADAAKKELQDLRLEYKTEPKKAFTNTVTKARSFAKNSWKKRRHNKQSTVSSKPSSSHDTKTEKRESAAS